MQRKIPKGSFVAPTKEPLIERVIQLAERYPSRSAAARAWGININTIKNYYRRKDIQPIPRDHHLRAIAEKEGVSMEWLLNGDRSKAEVIQNPAATKLDDVDLNKTQVISRIGQLLTRYNSRSAAARAWGINVNTLNSYFKSSADTPMPRDSLLRRIAENEGVSLEWLKTGNGKEPKSQNEPDVPATVERVSLADMLSFLTDEERERLTAVLARKGVDTVVQLVFEFANLSPSELERAVRLLQQIREGASEADLENELTHPTHKQAG